MKTLREPFVQARMKAPQFDEVCNNNLEIKMMTSKPSTGRLSDSEDSCISTDNITTTETKTKLPFSTFTRYDLQPSTSIFSNKNTKNGTSSYRRRFSFYSVTNENNEYKPPSESLNNENDVENNATTSQESSITIDNDAEEIVQNNITTMKSIHSSEESSCDLYNINESITRSTSSKAFKLLFGASGIYLSYLIYGHIQEDLFLYQSPYSGDKFHFAWMLQALESFVIVCFGSIMMLLRFHTDMKSLPQRKFFQSGASQVMSKTFTSLSLSAGLSFPVCTLAKSAKIVPVMIGQVFLGGSNKYTTRDYVFAALLVTGTAILSMNTGRDNSGTTSSSIAGIMWIAASLVMDGVTAGLQKRLQIETIHKPNALDFLLLTNMSMGSIALTVSMFLPTTSSSSLSTSNEFFTGLTFLHNNRDCMRMVMKLCCCSAIGQTFIFYIIAQFDPLVCSTITTTRKILSVIWSVIMKGHIVSMKGQFGILLAVGALVIEVYDKIGQPTKKNKQTNNGPIVVAKAHDCVHVKNKVISSRSQ